MDEFHWYADRDRGVAWQVPLLTLLQARFLLMSTTLGDVTFFAEDLTRRNSRETAVVKSSERPVPLEYAYSEINVPIRAYSSAARGKREKAPSLHATLGAHFTLGRAPPGEAIPDTGPTGSGASALTQAMRYFKI